MTGDARTFSDAEARRRIAEDLDATLFVEAAAGTGKTTALVGRIVALLRSGRGTLDRVVAVTFTEKAAGEMKLRVREELERARSDPATSPQERGRLETALGQLELARIATIHAFCGDLLHERPVEAGVDPLFEVAPEQESARLLERAFDRWFQETLSDPPEGVRRVLRRRPRGLDSAGPRELMLTAARNLVEHRDFEAPFRRDPEFERDAALDAVMETLESVAALADQAQSEDDWLGRNLKEIQRFVSENRLREEVRGRDHDALEADLRELARARRTYHWHWRGRGNSYAPGLPRDEALARRDAAKAALDEALAACDADLASHLREELRPVVRGYESLKSRAGKLDFLDLLVRARDLIVRDAVVRRELQERFTHFFVDEFQDTDPLQAEILLVLSGDSEETDWRRTKPVPGKLFLVGDPKQSIYRFRRADVAIYEQIRRQLEAAGAEVVHLTTSFRSVPALQSAVNAAFAPVMQGGDEGTQASYVPLEAWREGPRDRPALVALPVPRPYGDFGRVVDFMIEKSLPDAVGAFVDWLVRESGWTIVEREGDEPVAIAPRHVCLLFRRFKSFREDVTRPYVRALEARRVAHVLVGGRSFHEREEVLAIRNALAAIEWPDDPLRVFATLRGPLFALGDDALLAFRERHGQSLHPLRRRDEAALVEADVEVVAALDVLAALHRDRNRRPIAETISRLLEATRAHAGIAIWPTGEQALANCLRTIDLARRFERGGAPSFRAFVDALDDEADRGEAEDAPVVEEGTEGVRIMTVHRAKGLEFPIVILADPTCRATRDVPTRHVDPDRGLWAEALCGCSPHDLLDAEAEELRRDAEESVRVTYVAATRARDLLVVPVVGDEERSGWLDVLDPVVHPRRSERRASRPAPGCPLFGDDSVVDRGAAARVPPQASVKPGLHTPRGGQHTLVWWDPAVLGLDRQVDVGLRQHRILEADDRGVAAEAGARAHESWQRSRTEALERGVRESIRVLAVTELSRAAEGDATGSSGREAQERAEVRLERVQRESRDRPGGRRFGTLVHAILALVDLDAGADAVASIARVQGRLVGATPEEIDAAIAAACGALAHPILRRASASGARGGLRRETPVLVQRDDGTLAEGIVDLAFRDESGADARPEWTVVDFKTDREIAARRWQYEEQVRVYSQAVSAATGERAHGVLLVI